MDQDTLYNKLVACSNRNKKNLHAIAEQVKRKRKQQ